MAKPLSEMTLDELAASPQLAPMIEKGRKAGISDEMLHERVQLKLKRALRNNTEDDVRYSLFEQTTAPVAPAAEKTPGHMEWLRPTERPAGETTLDILDPDQQAAREMTGGTALKNLAKGVVSGASAGYVNPDAPANDAERQMYSLGKDAGILAPFSAIAKALKYVGVTRPLLAETLTGGIYGGAKAKESPEESRLVNAATDAALFGVMGLGLRAPGALVKRYKHKTPLMESLGMKAEPRLDAAATTAAQEEMDAIEAAKTSGGVPKEAPMPTPEDLDFYKSWVSLKSKGKTFPMWTYSKPIGPDKFPSGGEFRHGPFKKELGDWSDAAGLPEISASLDDLLRTRARNAGMEALTVVPNHNGPGRRVLARDSDGELVSIPMTAFRDPKDIRWFADATKEGAATPLAAKSVATETATAEVQGPKLAEAGKRWLEENGFTFKGVQKGVGGKNYFLFDDPGGFDFKGLEGGKLGPKQPHGSTMMLPTDATMEDVVLAAMEKRAAYGDPQASAIVENINAYKFDKLTKAHTAADIHRNWKNYKDRPQIMLDMDGLKYYNTEGGYSTADQMLKDFVDETKAAFPDAVVGREYSGDEFRVFFPEGTTQEAVNTAAERLETILHGKKYVSGKNGTTTFENVSFSGGGGMNADEATKALEAKRAWMEENKLRVPSRRVIQPPIGSVIDGKPTVWVEPEAQAAAAAQVPGLDRPWVSPLQAAQETRQGRVPVRVPFPEKSDMEVGLLATEGLMKRGMSAADAWNTVMEKTPFQNRQMLQQWMDEAFPKPPRTTGRTTTIHVDAEKVGTEEASKIGRGPDLTASGAESSPVKQLAPDLKDVAAAKGLRVNALGDGKFLITGPGGKQKTADDLSAFDTIIRTWETTPLAPQERLSSTGEAWIDMAMEGKVNPADAEWKAMIEDAKKQAQKNVFEASWHRDTSDVADLSNLRHQRLLEQKANWLLGQETKNVGSNKRVSIRKKKTDGGKDKK